ncbi:MAG: hypothetical protein JSW37_01000 [Anaerolineales bacterium]|nr:MAG: hypothetical protein JSW37_01000 [Anaerolineales bacterium]
MRPSKVLDLVESISDDLVDSGVFQECSRPGIEPCDPLYRRVKLNGDQLLGGPGCLDACITEARCSAERVTVNWCDGFDRALRVVQGGRVLAAVHRYARYEQRRGSDNGAAR